VDSLSLDLLRYLRDLLEADLKGASGARRDAALAVLYQVDVAFVEHGVDPPAGPDAGK
jgi:hypothetical protein